MQADKKGKMIMDKKNKFERSEKELIKAAVNYKKIMKEIDPFIKKKKINVISTAGKWCDIASLFKKCE